MQLPPGLASLPSNRTAALSKGAQCVPELPVRDQQFLRRARVEGDRTLLLGTLARQLSPERTIVMHEWDCHNGGR
jgi:hypothetical protein